MPDAPTLDDVRALLRDNLREVLELVAVRERHREDTSLLLESADTYRLALAALDDAERYRALRDAKCIHFSLTKNEHAVYYEPLGEYITGGPGADRFADVSDEEFQRMIDTNTVWEWQVYPTTPVGFHLHVGHSLDDLIDAARRDGA